MDITSNDNQLCFVSTLGRLRASSKDAVVSSDSKLEDPYIMYMHVDRSVQDKFVSILKETYNSNHAELILLCGSVGDGKSHMLSYCKQKFPEMMDAFYVHNDSTASLYVDKPASYTLKMIMDEFSDLKIAESNKKVILAINLGTLNNFLEADTDNQFGRLKDYVERAGILDEKLSIDEVDKYFHRVNFADYHLYELAPFGVDSSYIRGILQKITSHNQNNVFYADYCKQCLNCFSKDRCPIKSNYELLSDEQIQSGIITVIVECIVKNKLILSTRSLLNMIYEVIVDERVWDRGSLEPRKEPDKLTSLSFFNALLPNVLFGKRNSSEILEAMEAVDPMQIRNEKIDNFFIFYENAESIIEVFDDNLPAYKSLVNRIRSVNFSDKSMHQVKESVLRLLVRTCWITEARSDMLPKDEDYEEYMRALYAWNTGDYQSLKPIYGTVEKSVLSWNGRSGKDEMQLSVGKKKIDYHLFQRIQIRPIVTNLPKMKQGKLSSFKDELKLEYKYKNSEVAELDVDFSLYKLLKRVLNGYVPSLNDKKLNVKCVEFINRISRGGSKMEQLYIRDLSQKDPKEYKLSFDESFGYSFEVD